jgi:uncharacterized protein DUF4058
MYKPSFSLRGLRGLRRLRDEEYVTDVLEVVQCVRIVHALRREEQHRSRSATMEPPYARLEIRTVDDETLVTAIELLSPVNKRLAVDGADAY